MHCMNEILQTSIQNFSLIGTNYSIVCIFDKPYKYINENQ